MQKLWKTTLILKSQELRNYEMPELKLELKVHFNNMNACYFSTNACPFQRRVDTAYLISIFQYFIFSFFSTCILIFNFLSSI